MVRVNARGAESGRIKQVLSSERREGSDERRREEEGKKACEKRAGATKTIRRKWKNRVSFAM
jgi:hypothetical protein